MPNMTKKKLKENICRLDEATNQIVLITMEAMKKMVVILFFDRLKMGTLISGPLIPKWSPSPRTPHKRWL